MAARSEAWFAQKAAEAREQLPAAERELAEASAAFEQARFRRDAAIKRYRKLRATIEAGEEDLRRRDGAA